MANSQEEIVSLLRLNDRELREQLSGAADTVRRLRDRCDSLKLRLLSHVDRGEGLTQHELVDFFTELQKLVGRVRKGACPRDTDGDGNCGRRFCPYCGEGVDRGDRQQVRTGDPGEGFDRG